MSTDLIIPSYDSNSNSPAQLTRRQMLALLTVAPFAALPATTSAGDPLKDKAAYLTMILIPMYEELLAAARRELVALGGS